MTNAARLFLVTGRVQGVFFRASTRDVAVSMGLTGHAVNLPDGSVEVLAAGPVAGLDELERWLYEGPRAARVSGVEVRPADPPAGDGFRTG